ncbi:MAG: DEAD/DEAH box helicase [Pirellulales bacterium]|nr:DEAD/DEAH box helicase [Pirellulales bacterium]
MDVPKFLDRIRSLPFYEGQLAHVELLAGRDGQFAAPAEPLSQELARLLEARGIEALYSHQVAALEHARAGEDFVVVTGTASGKTLCYNLPIFEATLADPDARALYLFPTKALAQDQLKGLLELLSADPELAKRIRPGVYDGDTPTAQRRRIKAEANLMLSNPDMLHASILPYHPKWARMFEHLKYIVLDEVHTYRGILGAHVSCVLRRLLRVCEHYGSSPVVLSASATIANPAELVGRMIDREVSVVDNDGSPRGNKYFALWNPTPHAKDQLARRSASDDAVELMIEAIDADAQALSFCRTRQQTELVNRYVRTELAARRSPAADKMRAYRGGYLPNERRAIEQALFAGELRGVAATNALELGVDIGSLDVALLIGYPGTIASAWQQAGRSGRRHDESLAVLLAGNDPVDQYLLRHPAYFFSQSPEHAVVDPENPYVLAKHLSSAAFELPLAEDDVERFGPLAGPVSEALSDDGKLCEVGGRYYFAGGQNPAAGVSLRHMSDNTFSIVLRDPLEQPPHRRDAPSNEIKPQQVIANVDSISAPELVYPEAVYMHNGETYFVRHLDLEGKVAYVERHEMDYYTQAVLESNVLITDEHATSDAVPRAALGRGPVDVSWQTVAFKKIKFDTRENIGLGPVDIPPQNLETTALWLTPDDQLRAEMKSAGLRASEGVCGLRNLAVVALPMVAMCDSRDVGGVVDSKNRGRSTMILYDRYPGGLGYAEKGYERIDQLLALCHEMVADCDCVDGCPSCVGLPNRRPAIHSDPDLTRGYPIPNKAATLRVLELMLARETAGSF